MTPRQAYAHAHPLNRADELVPEVLAPLSMSRRHATGAVLKSILAIDR